ncbi:aspartyl/glutamyl-tRNA(Asn/Gln) amidotransferase, B subunit [Exophiala sideris]|uniref:Glutamyl-tRNA(Gln) amidotransferase subunit B, mitochondrial n=1 Tax=Exophiala sideris TaxID=1016849 RepID=A0A0D1YID9_9EURO|nr:aspartyl/glutamyl-tRNA(Asn/Gln) amidotransferase, B subunit [Exophiala sideris]
MQQRWMGWTRLICERRCSLLHHPHNTRLPPLARQGFLITSRSFHSCLSQREDDHVPLRKQLKAAAKAAKRASEPAASESPDVLQDWELTVGIEIHAQLNTAHKLFSSASTIATSQPNSNVAAFDIALPGSLPVFQPAVVLPALRAATALGCRVEPVSYFDRKHYFYHDQPAGYQITQYYHPFAKNGVVSLNSDDGLEDGREVEVRIKQVQLEQDTARSQEEDGSTTLLDFNRCGQALIEIITLPDIHTPQDAAAYVRKVQALLYSVDAVTTGMEQGGMRADVNVSVRRRNGGGETGFAYSGVTGLGQRTEIKNLSTLRGIEDAIKAERDRQISVLEAGGVIEGETRGWSITNPRETRRLRGKEGEVDYRYMPDADIPPLSLHPDLVGWVAWTMPPLPTELVQVLVKRYGLSVTDAMVLESLDDLDRLVYFEEVVDELIRLSGNEATTVDVGKLAGNWVLHELGSLFSTSESAWSEHVVRSRALAEIVWLLMNNDITGPSAKLILKRIFEGDKRSVKQIVHQENLVYSEMSSEAYQTIATEVIETFPQHVKDIVEKGKTGKIQFLMGQMMRHPRKGEMKATEAEKTLRRLIVGEKLD